ncbi:hypothetical protein BC629DRAFT_1589790 [Irpex lacteus]|nr:hypothetical protein BC629DRAFT_1589790 [Irpex lacteus]
MTRQQDYITLVDLHTSPYFTLHFSYPLAYPTSSSDSQPYTYYNPGAQPQMSYFPAPALPSQFIEIKQMPYEAQSSRRNMSNPVEFRNSQTSAPGISLQQISSTQNPESLILNPETPVLNENVGVKLSYRLQFEGQQSFAKQKYAKTTGREIPVTRVKMARQVAEVVQAYFEDRGTTDESGVKWIQIGPGGDTPAYHIRYDQIYLVQVDHVTAGSLQPRLGFLPDYRPVYAPQVVAHQVAYQYGPAGTM